jgi:hypothetical protein
MNINQLPTISLDDDGTYYIPEDLNESITDEDQKLVDELNVIKRVADNTIKLTCNCNHSRTWHFRGKCEFVPCECKA